MKTKLLSIGAILTIFAVVLLVQPKEPKSYGMPDIDPPPTWTPRPPLPCRPSSSKNTKARRAFLSRCKRTNLANSHPPSHAAGSSWKAIGDGMKNIRCIGTFIQKKKCWIGTDVAIVTLEVRDRDQHIAEKMSRVDSVTK